MARADFNRMAPVYDAARGLSDEALEAWRAVLERYRPGQSGFPVLDLGCGTGLFATAIARWFRTPVIALDPAREMLHQALRGRSYPRVAYLLGQAERLPLRDASCDCAWLSTVIHHFHDLTAAARELHRVLRPSGPVLIRSGFPGREDVTHFHYFPGARRIAMTFPTIEATEQAFAAAGFQVEALESVPQISAPSLRVFCERVRLRADTTLAGLSDEEFAEGMRALEAAAAAETLPRPVIFRLDLLVLR